MDSKVTNRCAYVSDKLRQRLVIDARSPIDSRDRNLIYDALVMRTALLYDLLAGSTQVTKVTAAWERTLLSLRTLDVELYANDWKASRTILTSVDFRVLMPDVDACQQHFKRAASRLIHYKWITNACLALMEFGGDDWFRRVNQFIVFDTKLNLKSLDLTREACEEYLAFERDAEQREAWRSFDLRPDLDDPAYFWKCRVLATARRCARDMVGDFNITDYAFRPSHGNGATRECKRSEADAWHKNRQFTVDSEVINYLRYRVPESDWRDWFYLPRKGLNRTSELSCVPKSMTSNRTISAEPTTLQYLQHDVARALDDYFAENPACHINLHDQARSRALALAGSSNGSYATEDLSSASDSVSISHIDFLFEGLSIWYPLMATRSTKVHVRDRSGAIDVVITTSKFAPMGSSTCFPTECIVFAVLAECAIRVTKGRPSRSDDYVVYGDDIVIRDDCYEALTQILQFFGFTVNRDKSFGGENSLYGEDQCSYFREACGIECLDGVDITPLRLSRRLVSLTDNDSDRLAGQGVGMVDLLNRTYLYGFVELRRWISFVLNRHEWYRTILRVGVSDFDHFMASISLRLPTWVRVAMPFVITDDNCDTQWRCYETRNGFDVPDRRQICPQQRQAKVTIVVARPPRIPRVKYGSLPKGKRARIESLRQALLHDSNDYFSWCLSTVTDVVAEEKFHLDDTMLVTLRSRDLKWSRAWVLLN